MDPSSSLDQTLLHCEIVCMPIIDGSVSYENQGTHVNYENSDLGHRIWIRWIGVEVGQISK